MPVFVAANPSSCRRGICMVGVLALVLLGIWLFWSPTQRGNDIRSVYGATGEPAQGAKSNGPAQGAAQKQASPQPSDAAAGSLPAAHAPLAGQCRNPQAPEPQPAGSGRKAAVTPGVHSSLAEAPRISAAAGDSGWTLDASTFAPSQDSEDYYKHFKPVSLETTMPMGWRATQDPEKRSAGEEDLYGEFSRYTISPNQMKRAESMRSVLRLSELSRDGLSRTLGQRSLLRDFVTPLGPSPVGDSAMLWNDSSVRQNYIASATGRFPDVAQSC
jgi:hypothetical protein